ncbi:T9SS type A sorting domain-containing protein [Chryseobacterium turcicum]|uniref:T9SS type A sorting domain-containing protein n=1 Tax=Chryseobacterium turcicum TaxID=2898076 RepID=A0A9Q3V3M2_9FLAO|nr:T9SS type A sorting domain-containing protein [Chryseobacterium turcicum]MCD1117742.1 T9SS type A sorting domain-containing protein [Chryseobacterium turcicum]
MKKYLLLSSLIGFFGASNAQIQLQRDSSFGNNGIFTYNQGNGYGVEIFIQDDNSLLITNNKADMISNRYVVKISSNGILDNSFAQNGYLQLDNSSDTFHTLLQGNGGKFYINYADPYTSPINNRIISYNANGTVNSSFSNNGILAYNFSIIEGYFTSTEDGGLLLIKNDGFTKYLQTGNFDSAVGTNGLVTSNNSNYPLEPTVMKGNKLFFDNFGGTARIDAHTSSIVEKEAPSIYSNPIALYENYRTKVKNNYSLYYFRFTSDPFNTPNFTGIRLMKTDENLNASSFGSNSHINLPINPNVYNSNSTDVIYTPNGNYLIFGVPQTFGPYNFLAYDENGNQINVNSQQFFTDSGIPPYLSYVNLYSKGDAIFMVGVTSNNVSVIKYNIIENQPTLSTTENSADDTIVVNNPFGNSIIAKDEKKSILKMDLYSYSGTLILSTNKKEMSTLNIPKGSYILKITTKTGVVNKKLIKVD